MDTSTVETLFQLNGRFYRENCLSFEASRHNSWPGWERCLAHLGQRVEPVRLLDVACGNLRFERFLARELPATPFAITACDSCDELAADEAPATTYRHVDIGAALLAGEKDFLTQLGAFDIVACFGFMHHVPTVALRVRLLEAIAESLSTGGLAFITFWRFADDAELRDRAIASDERARASLAIPPLDNGDFLVGWDNDPHAVRYCHSFTDGEIDELAHSCNTLSPLDRFDSDGRTRAMNTYLVMEKVPSRL